MNDKALRILEYTKIIDLLCEQAASDMGKELCRKLTPMTDIDDIKRAQRETSDALFRIVKKGSVSFSGLKDVGMSLKRLEIGASLGMSELLALSSMLNVASRVKTYGRRETDDESRDCLDSMFEAIEPLTTLNREINRCIISDEEMADDASAKLKDIRRHIRIANDRIHSELNSMVGGQRTYLQDAVVTTRAGRYCIPVKAEYRSQVPGMIHDQSSSGSTLFIEPMAVVKLNNELRELELKEIEEINVILANLSAEAAQYIDSLHSDLKVLTQLDFIFARANLSKNCNGSEPVMNTNGYINIKKGRHPLINPKKVVPIDVYLGRDFNLLVITGPNTGGKTVTLKTIGLFTLMGQAGLHIPAFDGSELSVFNEVFADIGDEQSIEQSLSTFSSHMTHIVDILAKADYKSLVLFDELCAGTDPTEGAALAISILQDLHKRQVTCAATTHYSEIKVYALSTPGVVNACCEFDVNTLSPTYRLLVGIPGKSNAFAISGKLGLPNYIIENAKNQIGTNDKAFEDLLANLEASRVTIEREREEISTYKAQVAELKKALEAKQERLDERSDNIIRRANEEAADILRDAKEYADEVIRKFNKYERQGVSASEMEKVRKSAREKLDSVSGKLTLNNNAAKTSGRNYTAKDFHIGDRVKVLSMNLEGTVHSLPDSKGNLSVTMGILNSQVNIKDVIILEDNNKASVKKGMGGSGAIKASKTFTLSSEINLIGMTVDEAIAHLDKYLDDAYLSHIPSVRIVHGKGSGALRNAVQNHLKRQKYIKSYRLGTFGEGDAGVTIAEFK